MNKFFICSTFLLFYYTFSFYAAAQDGAKGKLSAGIVFSPDYAFRYIQFPGEYGDWKELLNGNEHPIFGYSTGFSFLYRHNKKLELESGLLFSAKGYTYKAPGEEGWIFPEMESLPDWEINDPAVPLEATEIYNYRYLDVPLKLNWFFLQKKVSLFLSTGISAGLFLDEFVVHEEVYPDRKESGRYNQRELDFNPVVLSFTGGAGIKFPLSDRLHIRLNPEFRHAVTPLSDTPGKYYLWSAGMNTGIYFKIKKGGTSSHP